MPDKFLHPELHHFNKIGENDTKHDLIMEVASREACAI